MPRTRPARSARPSCARRRAAAGVVALAATLLLLADPAGAEPVAAAATRMDRQVWAEAGRWLFLAATSLGLGVVGVTSTPPRRRSGAEHPAQARPVASAMAVVRTVRASAARARATATSSPAPTGSTTST